MTGLTTQGRPTCSAAASASSRLSANWYLRRDEAELARGEIADPVAVHGQLDRLRRRRDAPPFLLELGQGRGVDRLDLRNDHVRLVLLDRFAERRAVEHREHLERVGDLHRGRILITVAGDHPAAEPLGGDRELPAQLAGAEQHQSGGVHDGGDSGAPQTSARPGREPDEGGIDAILADAFCRRC